MITMTYGAFALIGWCLAGVCFVVGCWAYTLGWRSRRRYELTKLLDEAEMRLEERKGGQP